MIISILEIILFPYWLFDLQAFIPPVVSNLFIRYETVFTLDYFFSMDFLLGIHLEALDSLNSYCN